MSEFKSRSEFKFEREIGEGGFGRALLVKHKQTHYVLKEVNLTFLKIHLKHLKLEPKSIEKVLENTKNEYSLMAKFRHPNIVHVYGSFEDTYSGNNAELQNSIMYHLVMEFCAGGNLANYLKDKAIKKPVEEAVFVEWAKQLVGALEFLHNKNLCHRDVKPANIYLTVDEGTLKLGDFGLAKDMETMNNTSVVTTAGTIEYWSPELCDGQRFAPPCDVWALGVTLYEIANCKRPFSDGSFTASMKSPQPFLTNRSYSPECRSFVMSFFEKDSAKRPTMAELIGHDYLTKTIRKDGEKPFAGEEKATEFLRVEATVEILGRPLSKSLFNNEVEKYAKRLHQYAIEGDLESMKYMLGKEIPDLLSVLPKKPTELLKISECLKPLMQHRNGWHGQLTALMEAIEKGHLAVVQYLVENHPMDLLQGLPSFNSLLIAANFGHLEIVRYLMEGQSLVDPQKLFIESKFDQINWALDPLANHTKSSALHLAAEEGFPQVLQYFIENQNIDVNLLDASHRTALFWAAKNGKLPAVQYLVEGARADVSIKSKSTIDMTAIHAAAFQGHASVVRYLVDRCPDTADMRDSQGNLAVHWAAYSGHVQVLHIILEKRKDLLYVANHGGKTPFGMAEAILNKSVRNATLSYLRQMAQSLTITVRTN